jgi:hypothetical protein
MQTVQAIIQKTGGFALLKRRPIRIDHGGNPALVIQYLDKIGVGATDYLRVMRVEDMGDEISRVFEMGFECKPDGSSWRAVVWHCELTGETRYVYTRYPVNDSRELVLINMEEMQTLRIRANAWDENLKKLRYLEAAGDDLREAG